MSPKKSFVLRLDPEMWERLEKWAADEFRSANGQIEWLLDQALKKAGRSKYKDQNAETKKNQDNDL
jgi:hypothetical protein